MAVLQNEIQDFFPSFELSTLGSERIKGQTQPFTSTTWVERSIHCEIMNYRYVICSVINLCLPLLTGCEKNQPSLYLEQENVNAKVESDVMEMEVSESQMESRRAKRKSSTGVSYAEPGLRRYQNYVLT